MHMLWTDQLEVAAIESEQALDVQAFRYRYDQRIDKVVLRNLTLLGNSCHNWYP
jgi:hypothetical protein